MAEQPISLNVVSGKISLVRIGAGSESTGLFTIPVMIGLPRNADASIGGLFCPCADNCCGESGNGNNWMGSSFDLTIGDAKDCCKTFYIGQRESEVVVDISIDKGKVWLFLKETYTKGKFTPDAVLGGLDKCGWEYKASNEEGDGTFQLNLTGFVNTIKNECSKITGVGSYDYKIVATASFSIESFSKTVKLAVCNLPDSGKDGYKDSAKAFLEKTVFSCSTKFLEEYKGGAKAILFLANRYSAIQAPKGFPGLGNRKLCCTVIEEKAGVGTYNLARNDNYMEISGGDCENMLCKTNDKIFRDYLNPIMTTELAMGGFPYIVPESMQGTMVREIDNQEYYIGYKMSGERIDRQALAEKVISRGRWERTWKYKPVAYVNRPELGKIGFAINPDQIGKGIDAGMKASDVWTLSTFAEYSRSVVWEMIQVWRQTIEASVGYASDSGKEAYKILNPNGGTAEMAILGAGGTSIETSAPKVYLTAHDLEMRKMFIAQYERLSASAGLDLSNEYISFKSVIATDGASYTVGSSISVKQLLGILTASKERGEKFKDSLTVTLPSLNYKEGQASYSLEDVSLSYSLHAENNWDLSVSGFKPLEYIPKDGSKDLSPKSPISLHFNYKPKGNNSILTLDMDAAGKIGLGLSYRVPKDKMMHGLTVLEGSVIQSGFVWDMANKKMITSWALQKSITDALSFQLGAAGADITYALRTTWGSHEKYLGKIDVGFAAALHAGAGGGWSANFNLEQEKTVLETATFLGDLVWSSHLGGSGGTQKGQLSGFAVKTGGWSGLTLKNDFLSLFGIPFNVNPNIGVGLSWMLAEVKSDYFGTSWSGMKHAVNFGLFGIEWAGVGRKDIIESVLRRKRYARITNLWGLIPWGEKESDEDFIGRAWPCLVHELIKFAEEDWKKIMEDLPVPPCWMLKDMDRPLIGLHNEKGHKDGEPSEALRKEIYNFYEYWVLKVSADLKNGSDASNCFKRYAPVAETIRIVAADFPHLKINEVPPCDEPGDHFDFSRLAVKAYLFYKREKDYVNANTICVDQVPDAKNRVFIKKETFFVYNKEGQAAWGLDPYKPSLEQECRALTQITPKHKDSYLVKKYKDLYEIANKSKWIIQEVESNIPTSIEILGKDIETINQEDSLSSQFAQMYVTGGRGNPVFDQNKFLKDHNVFPYMTGGNSWLDTSLPFKALAKGVVTMVPSLFFNFNGKKDAAANKFVTDPYWGLVKCYWTKNAPHGTKVKKDGEEGGYWFPYDPNTPAAKEARLSSTFPQTRPGFVYRERAGESQGKIVLVIPWENDPGKSGKCRTSIFGNIGNNSVYDPLHWFYSGAEVLKYRTNIQAENGPADAEVKKLVITYGGPDIYWNNMADVPWKGNPQSCYLTFYEYMHMVELDALSEYLSKRNRDFQGASGKDIINFQIAKAEIIKYCGYTKDLEDNLKVYTCTRDDLILNNLGLEDDSENFIGHNILVRAGSPEHETVIGEVKGLRELLSYWEKTPPNGQSAIDLSKIFGKCDEIKVALDVNRISYLQDHLTFIYSEEWTKVFLKEEDRVLQYPSGGLLGWYEAGESVTNLAELSTLREFCFKFGTTEGNTQHFVNKLAENYNVIQIKSDALALVSDPIDGGQYHSLVINGRQLPTNLGKDKIYSNNLAIRNDLQELWTYIDCDNKAFPRERLFPWAQPGSLGHGDGERDYTTNRDGTLSVLAVPKTMVPAGDIATEIPAYKIFYMRYSFIWSLFVNTFENLYPLQITSNSQETLQIRSSESKIFYGLVMKDLGLAYLQLMQEFQPWIDESLAIVKLAHQGMISVSEAVYRLEILLAPFIENYPSSCDIQGLERKHLVSIAGDNIYDARYLGINKGEAGGTSKFLTHFVTDQNGLRTWCPNSSCPNWLPYPIVDAGVSNVVWDSGKKKATYERRNYYLANVLYYLFDMSEIIKETRTLIEIQKKKPVPKRISSSVDIQFNISKQSGYDWSVFEKAHNPTHYEKRPSHGTDPILDKRILKRCQAGSSWLVQG